MRPPSRDLHPPDDFGAQPPRSEMPASAVLMARAATRFQSIADLASRLDVAPSHVSRVIKGLVGLSVETSIRLADVLGESRASVLWACAHEHVAALLYADTKGKPRERVRDTLDQLTRKDRRLVESLAQRLSVLAAMEKASSSAGRDDGDKDGARRAQHE